MRCMHVILSLLTPATVISEQAPWQVDDASQRQAAAGTDLAVAH